MNILKLVKQISQPKIIRDIPPIWDQVIASGMRPNINTVVFTYGDTLYVPNKELQIPDDIIEHEKTHIVQQKEYPGGKDAWWQRYMQDPYFRIQEEAEAYATQYRFICMKYVKDRNQRNRVLIDLGHFLSGPMYGNIISNDKARQMIKELSGI